MDKKVASYSLGGLMVLLFLITVAGGAVKGLNRGRIAPGILLCGRDVSGMTVAEVEGVLKEMMPEFVTEVRCRVLPEMRDEIEEKAEGRNRANIGRQLGGNGTAGAGEKDMFGSDIRLSVQEKELCLTVTVPPVRFLTEDTLAAVTERSGEVKVWEWLYAVVTGQPFQIRQAEPELVWEEERFGEWIEVLEELTERDTVEATVGWENGCVEVSESRRGFRLEKETLWADAERVMDEVTEHLKTGPVEGMVLRLYVSGTALMPKLSAAQAQKCNTVIGAFATTYTGAGTGRAQNIKTGAEHLHAKAILPGEEFSVAEALLPFTEENGYAAGGTYIDGQLSESIGGGVCQLSTTLYNALLQTRLEITERYPHSMPVGYIPLGQDAAIAGDYKDLKFRNITNAPVLLLCEANGEEVKVTLYGCEEAKRGGVSFESVVTEETEEKVTVEVYRTETEEGRAILKERVSRDTYRVRKEGGTGG